MMAGMLLNFGGGSHRTHRSVDGRPQIDLATLDQRVQHLQLNTVEKLSFLHQNVHDSSETYITQMKAVTREKPWKASGKWWL